MTQNMRLAQWLPTTDDADAGEVVAVKSPSGPGKVIPTEFGTSVGIPGPTGPQGPPGSQGPAGSVGPKGDPGVAGPTGATGSQGPQGLKGDQGDAGPAGPAGPTGADSTVPGPAGPQGLQGIQGPAGSQGIQGPPGAQGIQGPEGPEGDPSTVPGPAGPTGATGSQGIQGPQGEIGPVGPASTVPGPQGPAGPTGATGATGGSFPDAPSDSKTYGRRNAAWSEVVATGGSAATTTFAPAGNIAATNVQAAIVELDNEKVAKAGDTMTGLLSIAPVTGNATFQVAPVEAAKQANINFLQSGVTKWTLGKKSNDDFQILDAAGGGIATLLSAPAGGTTVTFGKAVVLAADPTVALGAATKQYVDNKPTGGAASGVTFAPVTGVSATNVQAAIEELNAEKVAKAGDTMTGGLTIQPASGNPLLVLSKTGATSNDFYGAIAGQPRWLIRPGTSTAESGGNAGTDFTVSSFTDAGGVLDTPLTITRSSGLITVKGDPTANLGVATKQYVDNKGGGAASGVTFTPAGNIAATNVQAAIAELDNEKVAKAGDTMTGPLAIGVPDNIAGVGFNYGDGVNCNFFIYNAAGYMENGFESWGTFGSVLASYASRGTKAAPLPVQSGDPLNTILYYAADLGIGGPNAQIAAVCDAAPTVNGTPTAIAFNTGANRGGGTERLRIASSGKVKLPNPVAITDADQIPTKAYVDAADAALTTTANGKVAKAGDTMTGALSITDATASTDKVTGALKVTGGAGIGGSLHANRLAAVTPALGNPDLRLFDTSGGGWSWFVDSANAKFYLASIGPTGLWLNNYIRVDSLGMDILHNQPSTSSTTGTLRVAGGLGVSGRLNAGGTGGSSEHTFNGGIKASVLDSYLHVFNGQTKGIRFTYNAGASGIEGVDNTGVTSYQPLVLTGSALAVRAAANSKGIEVLSTGDVQISGTTASSTPTTGALQVAGGAGIAGNLVVGGGQFIMSGVTPGIEIGAVGAVNTPYMDWHSSAAGSDYDVRMQVSGGSGTSGQGTLNILAATVAASGALSAGSVAVNSGTVNGAAIQTVGKQTIWVPAAAMYPRTTNGAAPGSVETSANLNMLKTLDFDTSTTEYAQFEVWMPKSWNLGNVSYQPVWSHAATATNFGVVWTFTGVARSDNDAGDAAFSGSVSVTDTGGVTNNIYLGAESAGFAIAGTPAVGDTVLFRVSRTVGDVGDTMAVDARLHGIRLFYTTNAATDA